MDEQLEFLQSIPYFRGLGSDELESVKGIVFEKLAERGDLILVEGQAADVMYFVGSGVVKLFKTSADGKEQILALVRPGESINDVSVFDGGPNIASAQAMGPVVLYGIGKDDLDGVMREHPQVALNANSALAGQVRRLAALVEDLSFRHVTERVAKILLEYAGNGTSPQPRLTQQEMAAMAGTVREVVGRALKALEDEGMIRIDRHRIAITDRRALEDMVETYY
ncbi:MAG: Crp/Fnr family transcriptional regulator [Chloroflexota bacterium]|nr:Crp/Fnr family transcriptional regulator [Chloroflexota bacterium]